MEQVIEACKTIVSFVFSSVVIAELFKVFAEISKNKYNKKVEYKIDCVKDTDTKLKELIVNIKGCNFTEKDMERLTTYLYELQSYLDVSGYTRKYDYNSDGHAWKDIERLRNSVSENDFNANKELLLTDLILIQQFHRDSIKKEMRGKKINVKWIIILLSIVLHHTGCYYFVFKMNNFILYIFELFVILSTTILFPVVIYDSIFEREYFDKHARKRNTLKYVVRGKKKENFGQIFNSILIAFMGMAIVYLLQLASMIPEGKIYEINMESPETIVVSANEDGTDVSESKNEGVVEEDIIEKNVPTDIWELLTLSFSMNEFRGYLNLYMLYVIGALFCVFLIWNQKEKEYSYEKTVRKMRIEKNDLYMQEINELINKVKSIISQNGDKGYTLTCDKMLVLAYVKLDDMREYIVTEQKKRMSSMESCADVEREIAFNNNQYKIEQALKVLKKISTIETPVGFAEESKIKMFIKKILNKKNKKEENVKKIKKHLGEIIQILNTISV